MYSARNLSSSLRPSLIYNRDELHLLFLSHVLHLDCLRAWLHFLVILEGSGFGICIGTSTSGIEYIIVTCISANVMIENWLHRTIL